MKNTQRWQALRGQEGPLTTWGVAAVDVNGNPNRLIIPPSHRLDARDAGLIAATHNAALAAPDGIYLESLVNREGEPLVQFTIGAGTGQMTIRQARDFQDNLASVIEAAMTDAFLVRWMRDRVLGNADTPEALARTGELLHDFRQFRDEVAGRGVIDSAGDEGQPA